MIAAIPSIPSVPNLRDLGGAATAAGTVREGRLYRSVQLANLADADVAAFERLGVVTVVDLRTAGERQAAPDRVVGGAALMTLDVLADSPTAAAADVPALLENPGPALAELSPAKAVELMSDAYRDMVRLDSAIASYREFVRLLAAPTQQPLLFHCTTGKDRTGWAAAIVYSLLGADRAVIDADYLRTNDVLLPALEPLVEKAVASGADRDLVLAVLGVRPEYLDAAFAEAAARYGSMEAYLSEGLGADEATRAAVAAALVAPAGR